MNRAQVLTPLGFGCYEYKTDQSPQVCALALELRRAHGLEGPARVARPPNIGEVQTHVCQGPPKGEDAPLADPLPRRVALIDRVLEALRRSHEKLQERDLCERLNASQASKRVEKSLRILCNKGLVAREGTRRSAVYFALTWRSS